MSGARASAQSTQDKMRIIWNRYWRDTPVPPMSEADIVSLMMSSASRIVSASGGPFIIDLTGVAFAAKFLLPGRPGSRPGGVRASRAEAPRHDAGV